MSTTRREIMALLSGGEHGAKSISKIIRISEKEVYEHLEHINRTLESQNMRLKINPAPCLECGFKFDISTTILSTG
ncbi:MAG: ArsR family transcriptional regulator [Syntrophobacteraceae bacterium]